MDIKNQTIQNDTLNELSKVCNFCNDIKTLDRYRPKSNICRQCVNKKQAVNHLRHNKLYYQKHKEHLLKINKDNYYKRKASSLLDDIPQELSN